MTMRRRRFLQILLATPALTASADQRVTLHDQAFGARVSITSRGPFADRLHWDAAMVLDRLRRLEAIFSLFQSDSALSRLNRHGRLSQPPAELVDLLHTARVLHGLTGGLFNPAVQNRWRALAANHSTWEQVPIGSPDNLSLSSDNLTLQSQDDRLTLNGIAQGFATDAVAMLIRSLGYSQCLVNVGEFVAVGDAWRLGVTDTDGVMMRALSLSDSAVATSSSDGLRLAGNSHILHPRGAMTPEWRTVSVVATNATLADGLSTALIHMPRKRVAAIPRHTPIGDIHRIILQDFAGHVVEIRPDGYRNS